MEFSFEHTPVLTSPAPDLDGMDSLVKTGTVSCESGDGISDAPTPSLLSLPLELRQQIYSHVGNKAIFSFEDYHGLAESPEVLPERVTTLRLVCKQLAWEIPPLDYKIDVTLRGKRFTCRALARYICTKRITRLDIELGSSPGIDFELLGTGLLCVSPAWFSERFHLLQELRVGFDRQSGCSKEKIEKHARYLEQVVSKRDLKDTLYAIDSRVRNIRRVMVDVVWCHPLLDRFELKPRGLLQVNMLATCVRRHSSAGKCLPEPVGAEQ